MNWSTIRLIWVRELRDQFRDRRTVFTIVALPLFLYPLLSFLVFLFALSLLNAPGTVGIVTSGTTVKTFPPPGPVPVLTWLASPPGGGGLGAACLAQAAQSASADHALLLEDGEAHPDLLGERGGRAPIFPGSIHLRFVYLSPAAAREALAKGEVDVLVSAPPDFAVRLARGGQGVVEVEGRPADDRSRRTREQLEILLGRWEDRVMQARLAGRGLPPEFTDPVGVRDCAGDQAPDAQAAHTLLDLLVRTFPFMLVMWSLAGALHPAVDLCAGEKERGTMETLLITPAAREEIVLGKFLTIWVFSAATAVFHLVGMTVSTWPLRAQLPQGAITLAALFWCVVLVLPLAALFSAVCLAVGAYARSSKEGQYYLMPMFWVTMPLVFLTLAPGVELNQFYSMVPVTGVALLMRQLMTSPSLADVPWFYFLPVFATVILYSWIALRWAVQQFQSEEVLFREAERLEVGLWLRRLFREKGPLPTPALAILCFAMVFGLRWLTAGLGQGWPMAARTAVVLLAFVLTPPLLMAVLLTRRPLASLALAGPRLRFVLAAVLLLPVAELGHYVMCQFPAVYEQLQVRRIYSDEAFARFGGSPWSYWVHYILVLGLLRSVCEEVAFRGFILGGLRARMPAWSAVLLSAFLFAAYHMNVFALAPVFGLGVVLALLTVRSGSILPAVMLHLGCRILLDGGPVLAAYSPAAEQASPGAVLPVLIPTATLCAGVAAFLLWGGRSLPAAPVPVAAEPAT